jgi:hypothetical protein
MRVAPQSTHHTQEKAFSPVTGSSQAGFGAAGGLLFCADAALLA